MILIGDCRETLKTVADATVHCCVSSPPYFGLRDYGVDGQIGLEDSIDEYIEQIVQVFREVRRVLRDDGTFWLNLGDSYAGSGKGGNPSEGSSTLQGGQATQRAAMVRRTRKDSEIGSTARDSAVTGHANRMRGQLRAKELMGIPWRVAFALQEDGWYLRQDIIWYKPNPMPESVRDRCTKSHEYIFLFSKSATYFFDADAIKEPVAESSVKRLSQSSLTGQKGSDRVPGKTNGTMKAVGSKDVRNKRSVWTVTTKPFKEAHFATFPQDLIEPCVLSGTSEVGVCVSCGSPWERIVARKPMVIDRSERTHSLGQTRSSGTMLEPATTTTIGWYPMCRCLGQPELPPKPSKLELMEQWVAIVGPMCEAVFSAERDQASVIDPFFGAGTTGLVAQNLGRRYIGCELNPEYVEIATRRLARRSPVIDALLYLAAIAA